MTDKTPTLEALKACPFCGGEAKTTYIHDGRQAVCRGCGATGSPVFHGPEGYESTEEKTISAWNTRAVLQPVTSIWIPITEEQKDGNWHILGGQYRYPGDKTNTNYIETCKWDKDRWLSINGEGHHEANFQHYLNEDSLPTLPLEVWYTEFKPVAVVDHCGSVSGNLNDPNGTTVVVLKGALDHKIFTPGVKLYISPPDQSTRIKELEAEVRTLKLNKMALNHANDVAQASFEETKLCKARIKELKIALVEAAIPLEAMRLVGQKTLGMSEEMWVGIVNGSDSIRNTLKKD